MYLSNYIVCVIWMCAFYSVYPYVIEHVFVSRQYSFLCFWIFLLSKDDALMVLFLFKMFHKIH